MLINLKPSEVFDCGCIGGLAEKSSEAPNMAGVVLLRVLPKATHLHVLQHTLRSEVFGATVLTASMVSSFPFKEPHDRAATALRPNALKYYATSPQANLPQSGFVLWSRAAGITAGPHLAIENRPLKGGKGSARGRGAVRAARSERPLLSEAVVDHMEGSGVHRCYCRGVEGCELMPPVFKNQFRLIVLSSPF